MEKKIVRDDVVVYYDSLNEDKLITVVLVHGFGVNRNMWQPQLDALKGYHVINIDVRGHGKSRPCNRMTVIDVCKDICKILEVEEIASAIMVGLSMGSYVAQEFVRLYPEKTLGVLVADGTPLFMKYPKWETISLKYSAPLFKLYRWKRLIVLMAKSSAIKESVQQKLIKMFSQLTKEEFVRSWATFAQVLHEEAVTVACPFYIAYGDQDKSGTIKSHVKDWKTEYPGCKVFKIPNAGHVSNMDNPNRFNQILLQMMDEVINNLQ